MVCLTVTSQGSDLPRGRPRPRGVEFPDLRTDTTLSPEIWPPDVEESPHVYSPREVALSRGGLGGLGRDGGHHTTRSAAATHVGFWGVKP